MVTIPKKGTCLMALYSWKLALLDSCNYFTASGFSYAKYLSTYGGPACQGGWKILCPYEYVDDLARLHDRPLPLYDAFHSLLHGINILEEGRGLDQGQWNYTELCWLWTREGMTSLHEVLVYYKSCNVVPFLMALQKQCNIYKEVELDMLNIGSSLPSIGIHFSMCFSESLFHMFGLDQADLA